GDTRARRGEAMYELSPEELFPYVDRVRTAYASASNEALQEAWLHAFLTGEARRFRGEAGVEIHLIPHASTAFCCLPLPAVLQAQVDAAHAQGQGMQIFVVLDMGVNALRRAEAPKVLWLLWNASRGVGMLPRAGDHQGPDTCEDIWAADLLECLTLLFESPGPEGSPI
ncbi:MAG TPA: hypothetical protein VLQ80_27770, partial [Candidatus Saccharimonadia bacterium]|nr:hypothetical protein [Candidatus Saccharimonadia bacterium]